MAIRVGINGFGRIGRLVFRSMAGDPDIEIVAVNGSADYETMVHLIKYDTIQGPAFEYAHAVKDGFVVDGHHVKVVYDRVPANLPWKKLGVDVVLGRFLRRAQVPGAHRRRCQEGHYHRTG